MDIIYSCEKFNLVSTKSPFRIFQYCRSCLVFGWSNLTIIYQTPKPVKHNCNHRHCTGYDNILSICITIFSQNFENMIEWNAENTFYFAAIISSLFLIAIYFLFLKKK